MRHTAAEKYELIRLVEGSDLPARQTLRELRLNRSTFYRWYHRYLQHGRAGLEPQPAAARRHWNRIPSQVRQRVVDAALADPERSPRELAWRLTDREGHFLSESSVYRILKAYDLILNPAFIVLSAAKTFQHPTHRPNELWQTDFTCLQVVGWGWYCLSTVLDDYARYIIAWMLRTSMQAADVVMETLDLARAKMTIVATPSDNTYPYGIMVNSAGASWYVDFRGNRLGSVDPETMEIREYSLPSPEARPRRPPSRGSTVFYRPPHGRLSGWAAVGLSHDGGQRHAIDGVEGHAGRGRRTPRTAPRRISAEGGAPQKVGLAINQLSHLWFHPTGDGSSSTRWTLVPKTTRSG